MRYAREAGIHEGPRTFLRLPETVHLLFYGKITDWHGESVLQAKIELSAMWLRAQTEGTVLLIGLQTVFGRWSEDPVLWREDPGGGRQVRAGNRSAASG